MDPAAYHGLTGEVVSTILPHTEADPVALLLQYLASFGSLVGRGRHYQVGFTRHFGNLFELLVGDTSKARKGTSADDIRAVLRACDSGWTSEQMRGGLSSGEGLIHCVRDPTWGMRKGVEELIDPGVEDKRFLALEPEFSKTLAVMKREGNTLSPVIRDAWDGRERLETLTKHSPTKATGACISIVGHITLRELRSKLDETAMANGFANRFLFACVKRSKELPFGGSLGPEDRAASGRGDPRGIPGGADPDPDGDERRGAGAVARGLFRAVARGRWTDGLHHLARGGPDGAAGVALRPARSSRGDRRGASRGGAGGVEVLRGFGTPHLRRRAG